MKTLGPAQVIMKAVLTLVLASIAVGALMVWYFTPQTDVFAQKSLIDRPPSNVVVATDWPQWRGLKRDGVWKETHILNAFPAEGLNIRWRQPVGEGWSSPVVADGRVFVSDADLRAPTAKERLHCFEARTGKPLWSHAYEVTYSEWAFVPGQGGGPCATPIVGGNKVYMLGGNGDVHCLATGSGAVVWKKQLGREYQVRELTCRPSPLIHSEERLLIVFVGGKPGASVIALDAKTGREIWKALDEPVSNSSPLILTAAGRKQLIIWSGESITSLDPKTGQILWREPMVTSNNDAIPSPVFYQNHLLVGGLMFRLAVEKPAAEVLWPKTGERPVLSNTSTALFQSDYLYSAKSSGELVCLKAGTGEEVWQTNSVTGLTNGASIHLTLNGDRVFLFTDQGNLILANLTPQGYQEISRARLLEPTSPFGGRKCAWAPPAYSRGMVFARNDDELVGASLEAEHKAR